MPLTTVQEGRVYDWSHAVGRNAARGPGFNYVQTMCLGKNGILYATNRGNENNFGMHVNKVQLGAPGDEEHIADFCEYGEGDVFIGLRAATLRQLAKDHQELPLEEIETLLQSDDRKFQHAGSEGGRFGETDAPTKRISGETCGAGTSITRQSRYGGETVRSP